jgi:hypothetical protein
MQTAQQAAQQAVEKAKAFGSEANGVFRTIMELSGMNPSAYQVRWDGSKASILELPKPEVIPEPEALPDNVVPLPAPPKEPESGDA